MNRPTGKAGAGALYGTLEVLVLKTLQEGGPLHGLDIARRIRDRSDDLLRVEEGALYPALHRLHRMGWIDGEWRISDKRRRARFYRVTPAGLEGLAEEIEQWRARAGAVNKVLGLEEA